MDVFVAFAILTSFIITAIAVIEVFFMSNNISATAKTTQSKDQV